MSKKFQIAYVDEADIDKGDYWLEYDDEYDDTYDENMVGSADVDSADELANTRLLFYVKQLFRNIFSLKPNITFLHTLLRFAEKRLTMLQEI